MKEEEVRDLLGGTPTEISLNAPVGEEGDMRLEEVIEDHSIMPCDDILIAQSFEDAASETSRPARRQGARIIERRFGLGDWNPDACGDRRPT